MSTPIRPTRRTVVRGAAWSAPAIASVAIAAPAAAMSGRNELFFDLGQSLVAVTATTDGSAYAVSLRHAVVMPLGDAIPAGQLTMVVEFVPDPGFDASQLVPIDRITGWADGQSGPGPFDRLTYTCGSGVASGQTLDVSERLSSSFLLQLALGHQSTLGTLVFTLTAPGFLPVSLGQRLPPPAPALQLDPGQTRLTYTGSAPQRTFGLTVEGLIVTPDGGDILANNLFLRAFFNPAPGPPSITSVTPTAVGLTGWSQSSPAGIATSFAVWRYSSPVSNLDHAVATQPDLSIPLFTEAADELSQHGTFTVRAISAGFASAEFTTPAF